MSPEQTTGATVDARSDIFSFGVVLYEALTGGKPFPGQSEIEVLAAIRERVPDPLPTSVPAPLRWIVEKALEKDPDERYQTMDELVVDLRRAQRVTGVHPALPEPRAPERKTVGRVLNGLILAALLVAAILPWFRPGESKPTNPLANARFTRLTDFPGAERDADISPDGKFVAFVSDRDGRFDIYIGQIGVGKFKNLSRDYLHEVWHGPDVSGVGFLEQGQRVWGFFPLEWPDAVTLTSPLLEWQPRNRQYRSQRREHRPGPRWSLDLPPWDPR